MNNQNINEVFSRRLKTLQDDFENFQFEEDYYKEKYVPNGKWQTWATSAQNLIQKICGEESAYYKNFLTAYQKCKSGREDELGALYGVFLSAKNDFEEGCIFDISLRISGEIFGDFIILAKQSLEEGHKDVAAVLACAALEDTLKRYALSKDISIEEGHTMQDIVNLLKSRGLVGGAQKSLLETMPRIRNWAMHANWDKISSTDIGSVLGFLEQFLHTKFSN